MRRMEEDQRQIERQTARIASIREISSGKYVKQEGWLPNYVITPKNEKISRVNLMGVVVTIPENSDSLFIDDGSGKIEVRTFENKTIFKDITIGDIVLIIGRPREFNSEIYINCEIVKKINNKDWLEYRKKEILLKNIKMPDVSAKMPTQDNNDIFHDETMTVDQGDSVDDLVLKIKELDKGHGCDIGDLIKHNPKAEEIVQTLLLKGEIFEIAPGKLKVLE
jgi:RPA family protein